MSDSPLKRLLVQTSHYGLTSVFTMIAGLVSFPLLTRLFSVRDYGAMNLVAATVTLSIAVGKLGVQHSILRFQSEITAGKSRYTLPELVSTTFFGMVASGGVVVTCLVVGARLVPDRWLPDERLRGLFAIASFMILAQVVESALVNFLRVEQKTAAFMKYQIGKKYLTLAAILVALFVVSRSLVAFYSASALAEMFSVAALGYTLFARARRPAPQIENFSRPLYRELIAFGIPMMIGYEMSGIVLSVGDRYVIEGLIGQEPLGLYSAAYNLCQYVQNIVIISVAQAIMPIYMQMWDQKGKEETALFISRSLGRYLMIGAPVVAGLAVVGPDLLPSLASAKYASAAGVLPWVIAGMVVDGTNSMSGAGLFIHKKTRTIMTIVVSGAIFNIVLNLILVPRIGITGSAIATLASYVATSISMALAGRSLLPVALPWATLLRSGAAATVMYFSVVYILPGKHLLTVGVRTAVGGVVYALVLYLIDADARALVGGAVKRLRGKG